MATMQPRTRVLFSACVAFLFYFGWTWWVNQMVSDDRMLVLRSAFVQGSYSAFMTATFTGFIDYTMKRMRCHKQPYMAVVIALSIQSTAVVILNLCNGTPNLVATVAPSILFSAIYGFGYARALRATKPYQCEDSDI